MKTRSIKKSYQMFCDPGHGWLRVKRSELDALGITNKISGYSYQKGIYAYLEEDCDASLFIKHVGIANMSIKEHYSIGYSKIRNYEYFVA